MLEEIRISGLGVIDDAVIEFGPGLNVISGETGAGKTMVVSGLGLLLGGRADASLVRDGSNRAVIEGTLNISGRPDLAERLAALEADVDDERLLVSRVVGADGRSRAFVGGRGVPVGVLADLMSELVAVHGQAEQLRLRQPASHRELLDKFGGEAVGKPLSAYQTAYERHREVVAQLHDVTTRTQERAREADALRFGLEEISAAAPEPGEDRALAAELARLTHADALQSAADAARTRLIGGMETDDADAQSLTASARAALESVAAHDDDIAAIVDRLREAEVLLAEAGTDLASYLSHLDADPARLEIAQTRQSVLAGLVRKYAAADSGVDGVLAWARTAATRLADLGDDDQRVAQLSAARDELARELDALAAQLTAARRAAAGRLQRAVSVELGALAMPGARLSADVRATTPGISGVDEVELQLAPDAGVAARPVQKAASGGELSRVMLALEVVLAGRASVATFVFDEVDAGVGGRAAAEVGRRLARLSRAAQVFVVTHLPQVAAFADRHLVVEKSTAKRGTVVSTVIVLDDVRRVVELSRMLAGQADSDHARGHAEELLAAAAAHRASESA